MKLTSLLKRILQLFFYKLNRSLLKTKGLSCVLVITTSTFCSSLIAQSASDAPPASSNPADCEQVELNLVPVNDLENPSDTTGLGYVANSYQIGKYDVTAAQYCAFLNAVAKNSDANNLYDKRMTSDPAVASVNCIVGEDGSSTYAPITGRENFPVTYVSRDSARRFCNWLHYGQPTGDEVTPATTETGCYDFIQEGNNEVAEKNPEANYFLPTENQWYKAAYYRNDIKDYWPYPTCSNLAPGHDTSEGLANEANYTVPDFLGKEEYCKKQAPYLTDVGFFSNTVSPYGAYDMGGNVDQWTDDSDEQSQGIVRGGSWQSEYSYTYWEPNELKNSSPRRVFNPSLGYNFIGFRVAASLQNPPPYSSIYYNGIGAAGSLGKDMIISTEDGTESIGFDTIQTIMEQLFYERFGLYFAIPYVAALMGDMAYEWSIGNQHIATMIGLDTLMDAAILASSECFGVDLVPIIADLATEAGFGFAVTAMTTLHATVEHTLEQSGIPLALDNLLAYMGLMPHEALPAAAHA